MRPADPSPTDRRRFFPRLTAAVGCGLLTALPAAAQGTDARALSGAWEGVYRCEQGPTALRMELRGGENGVVQGVFRFSALAENPGVPDGEYPLLGRLSGTALVLRPVDAGFLPEGYVPVGVQATTSGDARRIEGWIEAALCTTFAVEKTADADPADPLPGGYGGQRWSTLAELDEGALHADTRERPGTGGSTARVWVRWTPAPGEGDRVVDYDLEFDCRARQSRVWYLVEHAPDGTVDRFDGSPPLRWTRVAKGTPEELAYAQACAGG